jgi:hypothetical protein
MLASTYSFFLIPLRFGLSHKMTFGEWLFVKEATYATMLGLWIIPFSYSEYRREGAIG